MGWCLLFYMQDETIQAMGGHARAKALTAEQKSEIGKKAIAARWANRPIQATHKGSFQKDFGIDVECYVLNDEQKTPVLSQRGMGRALGLSDRGNSLPSFLESKAMSPFVGGEIGNKLSQPLKFQWVSGGGEQPPTLTYGYDAATLIDVCNAITQAEKMGALGKRYTKVAEQAHIILGASAKAGIRGLVYALAGYKPEVEEVIAAFKMYVQEEAKKYEREFPDELYQQWQRLYDLKMPERGKPWHFKHLTVNHIYTPLAKSDGKLLTLLREMKAKGGRQRDKLFQFLNEVGARALRMHMGRILEMAESSSTKESYVEKVQARFGDGEPPYEEIDPAKEFESLD